MRFDYMDFSHSIYRFDDFTLYLVRRIDKIRLIKSDKPMAISDFEQSIKQLNRLLPN